MKKVIFMIEDNELDIISRMFFVRESDENLKKLKKIERELFTLSGASWHNFHYSFFNSLAVKQLFGEREN